MERPSVVKITTIFLDNVFVRLVPGVKSVVWRENISFEIARQTAAMAQKGIEKHAYKLAGFEDSE